MIQGFRRLLDRGVRGLPLTMRAPYHRLAKRYPRFDVTYEPGFGRFYHPLEIALRLVDELDHHDRARLQLMPAAREMIKYHHGFGTWVRNRFGLWREANPYTRSSSTTAARHPDNLSGAILEAVYYIARGEAVPSDVNARLLGIE